MRKIQELKLAAYVIIWFNLFSKIELDHPKSLIRAFHYPVNSHSNRNLEVILNLDNVTDNFNNDTGSVKLLRG